MGKRYLIISLVALTLFYISGCGKLTETASSGNLVSISVTPSPARVGVGLTQQFIAQGFDAKENPVRISPSWLISGEVGTITSGGLFTAAKVGSGKLYVTVNGIAATVEVTVYLGLTVVATYDAPANAPSGIAWDGTNLWSVDITTKKIYQHQPSVTSYTTYSTVYSDRSFEPLDIVFAASTLWATGFYTPPPPTPPYPYTSFFKLTSTAEISDLYHTLTTEEITAITWDGTRFWAGSSFSGSIYRLNSDMTVEKAYGVGGVISGLAWDGTNLWSCDKDAKKIYKYDSSLTRIATYEAPGSSPTGLTFDGTSFWSCDSGTRKIYKHNPE